MDNLKFIVVSAPSGAGKSTIVDYLIETFPQLEYSISTCTRKKRKDVEQNGKDYHFVNPDEFIKMVKQGDFLEWEEVYPGEYYGTPKTELERISSKGNTPILILDVEGGVNVKKEYGDQVLTVFIKPKDMETLEQRLRVRNTETDSSIQARLTKATIEMGYESRFDKVIVNDNLETALQEATEVVKNFL